MEKYIYKITNNVNGKIYIGQTNDPHRRFREHKNLMYNPSIGQTKHLYLSFKKYGIENFDFKIIEKTSEYNQRELYWIHFYNSNNPKFGYNSDFSSLDKNHRGRLSEKDIQEIYWKLKNTQISYKELRIQYGLKAEDSIREINRGETYFHDNVKYPIRPNRLSKSKTKTTQIISELKDTNKSFKQIAEENDISLSFLYEINNGTKNIVDGQRYPVRKTKHRQPQTSFSQLDIQNIKNDIKYTMMTWEQLADKYGGNTKVYQHINTGKTYRDKNEDYPLRKSHNTRKFDDTVVNKIIDLLQNSNLTQKEISYKTNVNVNTISKIQNGKDPYHFKHLTYPLR